MGEREREREREGERESVEKCCFCLQNDLKEPSKCKKPIYDSLSDVGEIRVYFASKILTPCRMH